MNKAVDIQSRAPACQTPGCSTHVTQSRYLPIFSQFALFGANDAVQSEVSLHFRLQMNYQNNEIGYIGFIHLMSKLKGKKRFRKFTRMFGILKQSFFRLLLNVNQVF